MVQQSGFARMVRGRSKFRQAAARLLVILLFLTGLCPAQAVSGKQPAGPSLHLILVMQDQAPATGDPALQGQPETKSRAERKKVQKARLESLASASQRAALAQLDQLRAGGKIERFQQLWLVNAISVTASPDILSSLSQLPGVASVEIDRPVRLVDPNSITLAATPGNLEQINAPYLWNLGFKGQGMVVANVDSGVSLTNLDLSAKWRGGNNSWLDLNPDAGFDTSKPYDSVGHGTNTMGLMASSQYGVAPMASWIAVKIFNSQGSSSTSLAIQAFQWLLDPDKNPNTADAPDVINNSWSQDSPGCLDDPAMHTALKNLVSAGILPIFAAGNLGWGQYYQPPNDPSPSNYPEVLAVGSVDGFDNIASFSSQGPSTCRKTVFPDIVAPGVNLSSTGVGLNDISTSISGTSFSAPHAAGALALLLQAFPNLPVNYQKAALSLSADDLGVSGPDNTYGYGRLNLQKAFNEADTLMNLMNQRMYLPLVQQK